MKGWIIFLKKLALIIFLLILILQGCSFEKGDNTSEINLEENYGFNKDAISSFLESINNNNSEKFSQIISNSGLVVIRNFSSGTYGARGKNIRNYYTKDQVPENIEFKVDGEIPIKPSELFQGSLNSDIEKIDEISSTIIKINLVDSKAAISPSTSEVINKLSNILEQVGDVSPQIIDLNNEIILSEIRLINDILIGSAAVFIKEDGKIKLRAIIDLK